MAEEEGFEDHKKMVASGWHQRGFGAPISIRHESMRAKIPQAVYDHACAAWGTYLPHHRHQRGLAASECLDQHRLIPCVSGEPG